MNKQQTTMPHLYHYTDPAAPPAAAPTWFYHLPTHTLIQAHFAAGPDGACHLTGHQPAGEIPDQAIQSVAAWLHQHLPPSASRNITALSRGPGALPPHLILLSTEAPPSILIHMPAIGFTAGIASDGSKIPPHWQKPGLLSKEQMCHVHSQAADILIAAIASHHHPSSHLTPPAK
jgi:hypothetical protein